MRLDPLAHGGIWELRRVDRVQPRGETAQRNARHFALAAVGSNHCDIAMVEPRLRGLELRELRSPVEPHPLDHGLHGDPPFAFVLERQQPAPVEVDRVHLRGIDGDQVGAVPGRVRLAAARILDPIRCLLRAPRC